MDGKTTYEKWVELGTRKFGPDMMDWKFKCPSCGYVASVREWKEANAPKGTVAFSCVGRYTGSEKEMFDKTGGPCNYAGGGLFKLNPILVEKDGEVTAVFAFAD